ncbi:TPA: hypothetical protein ACNHS6_002297 [Enterococcus faecalis]
MKVIIEVTPEEVKELLQAVGNNLEQELVKNILDPSSVAIKKITDAINKENNKRAESKPINLPL